MRLLVLLTLLETVLCCSQYDIVAQLDRPPPKKLNRKEVRAEKKSSKPSRGTKKQRLVVVEYDFRHKKFYFVNMHKKPIREALNQFAKQLEENGIKPRNVVARNDRGPAPAPLCARKSAKLQEIIKRSTQSKFLELTKSSDINKVISPISLFSVMMQISETYTEKYEQDSLKYFIGNADTCIYDAYQGIYKQLQQKDEDATVIHSNAAFIDRRSLKSNYQKHPFVARQAQIYKKANFKKNAQNTVDIVTLNMLDNYAARDFINSWVKNETNGLIPTIIENPLTLLTTSAIFSSSLYLNVSWPADSGMHVIPRGGQFLCFNTRARLCQNGLDWLSTSAPIELGEQQVVADGIKMHIVDVPLSEPNMMLQIWEPMSSMTSLTYQKNYDKVLKFIGEFTDFQPQPIQRKFAMPLFETETVINSTEFDMFVNSYMRSLVYDSDLINTTAGDKIKLTHKVKLVLNENGIEGAAVTAGAVTRLLHPSMRIDKPFFYFIKYKCPDADAIKPCNPALHQMAYFFGFVRDPSERIPSSDI